MGKKSLPSRDSSRQNRYVSLGGGASRADETDNWAMSLGRDINVINKLIREGDIANIKIRLLKVVDGTKNTHQLYKNNHVAIDTFS